MDIATFHQRLRDATQIVIDFTREHCFNELPEEYAYIITPNSRTVDPAEEYLTEHEIAVLQEWNRYEDVPLTAEEAIALLLHDGKVPVWIDITVRAAAGDLTVLRLFCSRRLREDKDLMHQPGVPPFHIQVLGLRE
jgi:hypothetical protein